jgi:hypothetical protein
MLFSVITAPIVLAQLIDFLIRRRHVNPNIHPANSICHAYSRYEYVSASIHVLALTLPTLWSRSMAKIYNASPIRRDNDYL